MLVQKSPKHAKGGFKKPPPFGNPHVSPHLQQERYRDIPKGACGAVEPTILLLLPLRTLHCCLRRVVPYMAKRSATSMQRRRGPRNGGFAHPRRERVSRGTSAGNTQNTGKLRAFDLSPPFLGFPKGRSPLVPFADFCADKSRSPRGRE